MGALFRANSKASFFYNWFVMRTSYYINSCTLLLHVLYELYVDVLSVLSVLYELYYCKIHFKAVDLSKAHLLLEPRQVSGFTKVSG